MSITAADRDFFKSEMVTDTPANGGRVSRVRVISGAQRNLFPYVSASQRAAGVTKYRKEFTRITKAGTPPESALDVTAFLLFPSVADDRKAIALGTDADTEATFDADRAIWLGPGYLSTDATAGDAQITVETEGGDIDFPPGGQVYIGNIIRSAQTVDADVKVGDSVTWNADHWEFAAYDDDYDFPRGLFLGDGRVLTIEAGVNNEQMAVLPENLTSGEVIGTGNGSDTAPSLAGLAAVTNGVWAKGEKTAKITATCGGVERTVTLAPDGTCEGYCSAGEIDLSTGGWTALIDWTTAPDSGTDIVAEYRDQPFSYSGLTCTIDLGEQLLNDFTVADNTTVAAVLRLGDIVAYVDAFTDSSAGGIYDNTTYPVEVSNDAAETDTFTIILTSGTAFDCSGLHAGDLGSGNTSSDFSPINPATGTPYFTLRSAGWTGAPVGGDTISFDTHAAAGPGIWWRQIVPAGAAAAERNIVVLRSTNE